MSRSTGRAKRSRVDHRLSQEVTDFLAQLHEEDEEQTNEQAGVAEDDEVSSLKCCIFNLMTVVPIVDA